MCLVVLLETENRKYNFMPYYRLFMYLQSSLRSLSECAGSTLLSFGICTDIYINFLYMAAQNLRHSQRVPKLLYRKSFFKSTQAKLRLIHDHMHFNSNAAILYGFNFSLKTSEKMCFSLASFISNARWKGTKEKN